MRAGWAPPRPAEVATIGSALFLVASALTPDGEGQRGGLLVGALAVIAYSIVWYRILPPRAFGSWRYEIAGSFIQLIALYTLFITGGVSSQWFAFYLLPVIATVFSYRPRATLVVALTAAVGVAVAAVLVPNDDGGPAGRAALRLIELAAIAGMAVLITRAMRRQRSEVLAREAQLRDALATTEREALTDPLTGVHNRRSLDQALAAAASRAERDERPYSVLLIDVDHLKELNDRAGHGAGDTVLRLVGRAAVDVVRAYDLVGRFGGDEFVVVIADTSEEAAARTAERIEQRFAQLLAERPEVGSADISIGVSTWAPGRGPGDLLAEADERMYAAKRGRRHAPPGTPRGR